MLSTKRLAVLVALTVAFAVPLQSAQAAPLAGTFSSGDLNLVIQDAEWIVVGQVYSPGITSAKLNVPDLGTITDVNVRMRAAHTLVSDVGVFLNGPGETSVFLAAPTGDNGDDFGTGAASCDGTFTVFDDSAPTSIDAAKAPFAGTFKPHEPLQDLVGKPMGGDWELTFIDLFPTDAGTLYCWELEITYEPPGADLFVRGSDSPDPVKVGKRIRYTLTVGNNGAGAASNVTVVDTLPRGTGYVSASASQGSCSRSGRRVTCELGDLADGDTAKVTVVAKAPATAGRVTNVAVVSGDYDDPVTKNNRVQIKTKVQQPR